MRGEYLTQIRETRVSLKLAASPSRMNETQPYLPCRRRSRWWIWLLVAAAALLQTTLLVLATFWFWQGYVIPPPASVLFGQWESTGRGYTEIVSFYPNGSYSWTISGYKRTVLSPDEDGDGVQYGEPIGPELPPKTVYGTWTYHRGRVSLSRSLVIYDPLDASKEARIEESGPQDGLVLQWNILGQEWDLFDGATFGEGFDMLRVNVKS